MKKTLVIHSFVWLLAAGPAQATPASEAALAEGQVLKAAKQYAEAAEKFEAAVAADPKHAAAWYELAASRRRSGRCDRAIVAYRRYAAFAATEPEPYYGLGLCLRDTGDRSGALTALKRYLELEKRADSQKWIDHARGVVSELSAGPSAAAPPPSAKDQAPPPPAKTQSSSPVSPAYAEAQSLRDSGRVEEAIAKFRQAIASDPRNMLPRVALGELLLKIRRDDEAIEVLRAAVERGPSHPLALYDMAFALRVRGRMTEAVDAYERYIKLRPTDPDPYYGLGRSLQHLGRTAAARKAFETYVAMEKNPSEQRWVASAQSQIRALGAAR